MLLRRIGTALAAVAVVLGALSVLLGKAMTIRANSSVALSGHSLCLPLIKNVVGCDPVSWFGLQFEAGF